jgi:hypothetical protein
VSVGLVYLWGFKKLIELGYDGSVSAWLFQFKSRLAHLEKPLIDVS